jgi:hypothetical protein
LNFDFFIGPPWTTNPARKVHFQNVYRAGELTPPAPLVLLAHFLPDLRLGGLRQHPRCYASQALFQRLARAVRDREGRGEEGLRVDHQFQLPGGRVDVPVPDVIELAGLLLLEFLRSEGALGTLGRLEDPDLEGGSQQHQLRALAFLGGLHEGGANGGGRRDHDIEDQ